MKYQNNKKGFTLVELITTISIISIILVLVTTCVIVIINTSKEKSIALTKTNIFNASRSYAEEYYQNSEEWIKDDENNQYYSCVLIQELINKGLIKKEIKKQEFTTFVKVWKDTNNSIIYEEFDNEEEPNSCLYTNKKIKRPTKEATCKSNLIYNGQEQTLTTIETSQAFDIVNNKQTNAGNYTVTFKLKNRFYWENESKDDISTT